MSSILRASAIRQFQLGSGRQVRPISLESQSMPSSTLSIRPRVWAWKPSSTQSLRGTFSTIAHPAVFSSSSPELRRAVCSRRMVRPRLNSSLIRFGARAISPPRAFLSPQLASIHLRKILTQKTPKVSMRSVNGSYRRSSISDSAST